MSTDAVETAGEEETVAAGERFAGTLSRGDVVLLYGQLGAGKTAFVRGIAEGLRIDPDAVTSPTFTLVHEYRGGRLPLIHVDLYRLDAADLDEIGVDEQLAVRGVVAVEWSERLVRRPDGSIVVKIADQGDDRRSIEIFPAES